MNDAPQKALHRLDQYFLYEHRVDKGAQTYLVLF